MQYQPHLSQRTGALGQCITEAKMADKIQPTLGVDFDGTICDFEYPNIGKPKEGVKEALTLLRAMGYRIVIWTCRTCSYHFDIFGGSPDQPTMERKNVIEMVNYLKVHDIPYDEVDDGSRGKLHADYYIDDKAIAFQNNWEAISLTLANQAIQKKGQALNEKLQAASQAQAGSSAARTATGAQVNAARR